MKRRLICATLVTIASALVFAACGSSGFPLNPEELGINPYPNQPGRTDVEGEKNFATLINNYAEGRPAKIPWVGYWWAYTANGIANGAGSGGKSPAGKYDAARGSVRRTNAQAWEVKYHGATVPGVEGWWGHCNGWCAAAALYPEPVAPVQYGGITFSIGDLKALLTEGGMLASADFYGNRVDYGNEPDYKWDDVVPNQMFLVLTNYMGKLKMPVLMDRHSTTQVWNQPMTGYKYQYPKPEDYIGPAPDAPNIHRINMTVTIWWAEDGVAPNEVTLPFEWQDDRHFTARELRMELWLDGPVAFDSSGRVTSAGNIVVTRVPGASDGVIGGNWRHGRSSEGHPDYLWVPFSILNPADPNQNNPTDTYANPQVDLDWVRRHILTGIVDTTSPPSSSVPDAPEPRPTRSPSPGGGTNPQPGPRPTGRPVPL